MKITKVDEGIYRGATPVTIEDWRALRDLGIKFTLDLQTGATLMGDGAPLDEALVADIFGIRTYSHPLGEFLPPTAKELEASYAFLMSAVKKPVYVHCKAGVDRTGMVCAYYKIHAMNLTKSAAISEMKSLGMHPWYFYWLWSL